MVTIKVAKKLDLDLLHSTKRIRQTSFHRIYRVHYNIPHSTKWNCESVAGSSIYFRQIHTSVEMLERVKQQSGCNVS